MTNPNLVIDVVSDVVCPWCFIGKRRLEKATDLFKAQNPHLQAPWVRWNPFQLNPDLPIEGISRAQYLADKFGDRADSVYARVRAVGLEVGIDFKFDLIQHQPNTLLAHSLIAQAHDPKIQSQLVESIFVAYFLQGLDLSLESNLTAIAQSAGLTHEQILNALTHQEALSAIQSKDQSARALGINGVPFFIFNGSLGVSGAQEATTLVQAMQEALSESFPAPE
jgi:predicted DsbA family dithiol-disulfide isomerase